MIKILIVDDEVLVRYGLRTMIDWEAYGFEVVGEAADGEKALSLALENPPDIVLTDLVMPRMDGLALIRALKEQLPRAKVIVLSCHNDYELVREAMQLWGALDYLFKLAMQPQEILDVLLKVKSLILEERKQDEEKEAYRRLLQKNRMLEYSRFLQSVLSDGRRSPAGREAGAQQPRFALPGRPFTVFCFMLEGGRNFSEEEEERLCAALSAEAGALSLSLEIFSFSPTEYCALLSQPQPVQESAAELFAERVRAGTSLPLLSGARTVSSQAEGFREAYAEAHERALVLARPQTAYGREVQKALDYLRAHYQENIKLSTLADHVHMNESYLSTVIKKSTGCGFSDILNQVRIDEAKKLFKTTDLSVNEVSDRVGFSSWSYFSRVFKKVAGTSPAEYRRKVQPEN